MPTQLGTITIAPEVLLTIVRMSVLSLAGVARLSGSLAENMGRILAGKVAGDGIEIQIEGDEISVHLSLVAWPAANIYQLSEQVQAEVRRSLEDLAGMKVKEVNVLVVDVEEIRPAERGSREG
ncbi:MAG: Asp23/Gls24 family envelope stress response protein [Chloroflexi bacterium]|nr:Asp23/Gls24 family envelope stress response protein [Chloroflexota bacterium]